VICRVPVVVLPRFSASDVSMRLTLAFPICVLIVNGLVLQRSADVLELDPMAQFTQVGDTTMVTPTPAIEDSTRRDPARQNLTALSYMKDI
jgi:hypothetical protein